MNSELVQCADNRATVRVSLEAEEVARFFQDVYRHYSSRLKIPGFRKGKIPARIIVSRVGQEEISQQVLEEIRAEAVRRSVEELQLEVRSRKVNFTNSPLPAEGQAYELTYEAALLPEVALPDYRRFRIPIKRLQADEKMLAAYRERLLDRFTEYAAKEGAAELGDAIVYDLVTTFDDGQTAAPLRHEGVRYILGQKDNLPGYDEHFVGVRAGERRTFEYALPNDFPNRQVAGRTLIFEAAVGKVETVQRPEATPQFLKEHFQMDSAAEFERYLRETLEYELAEDERRYKDEVALSHLLGRMAVNLSEDMIKEELDYLVSAHERQLRADGRSLDELLKQRGQTLAEYREGLREEATRRLKEFLAVRAVARAENMRVTDDELSRYAATLMRRYNLSSQEMKKLRKNREFLNDAMMEILRAKVFRHITQSVVFYYEDEEPPPEDGPVSAGQAPLPGEESSGALPDTPGAGVDPVAPQAESSNPPQGEDAP